MTAVFARPRTSVLLALAWLAVLAAVTAWAAHGIVFDHYRGVWGVSIGTDTHYLSFETRWPLVTWQSAS